MNERENALMAYRHQKPVWAPLSYDCLFHVGFAGGNENGLVDPEKRDVFGVKWVHVPDPTPDPAEPFMLQEIDEWRDVVRFPKPREWDWDAIRSNELANYNGDKVLVWFSEEGMFDRLSTLAGFENALCWMITDSEETYELLGAIADYKIELIECVAEHIKPDVFMYTDDYCTKTGTFMSPETYRELIKPHHARIVQAIRDNGMIAEQHCCGMIEQIVDDFVEIGIESWFPAQGINDISAIMEKHGDKLCIVGGYDSQGVAGWPTAPDESIIAESHRIVDAYAGKGGYICMPMIMDTEINWALYEGSHLQTLFRNEFYRYSGDTAHAPVEVPPSTKR